MKPEISVIVPVYKVEEVLARTIESIIEQKFENFELILVDDGSPDSSGKICDEYARIDKRIQVFHQENGGVSVARNSGIKFSQGKYITFIDSDDWVCSDYLSCMVSVANNGADLVIGQFYDIEIGKKPIIPEERFSGIREVHWDSEHADEVAQLVGSICLNSSTTKLFHSSIIKDNNIFFDAKISWGEDTRFVLTYLGYCKKINVLGKYIYAYYNYDSNSLTHRDKSHVRDKILVNDYTEKCLKKYGLWNEISEQAVFGRRVAGMNSEIARVSQDKTKSLREKKEEISEIIKIPVWNYAAKHLSINKSKSFKYLYSSQNKLIENSSRLLVNFFIRQIKLDFARKFQHILDMVKIGL